MQRNGKADPISVARAASPHPALARPWVAVMLASAVLCVMPGVLASPAAADGCHEPGSSRDGRCALWTSYSTAPQDYDAPAILTQNRNETVSALSPDGTVLYVAGTANPGENLHVVAYQAASGDELWTVQHHVAATAGVGLSSIHPSAAQVAQIVVSSDGAAVFVTSTTRDENDWFSETVAIDTRTQTTRWSVRHALMQLHDLEISSDDRSLFLAGATWPTDYKIHNVVVALDATTGSRRWSLAPMGCDQTTLGEERLSAVAVGRDAAGAETVYATGLIAPCDYRAFEDDLLTVAVDAETGVQRWSARHSTPLSEAAQDIVVDPDLDAVYVTGRSETATGVQPIVIAYDASNGQQRWLRARSGHTHVEPSHVVADGRRVFAIGQVPTIGVPNTGDCADWATVAYDAVSGEELWASTFDGDGLAALAGPVTRACTNSDVPHAMALGTAGRVYVSGLSAGVLGSAATTVAYDAATGEEAWVGFTPLRQVDNGGWDNTIPTNVVADPQSGRVYTSGGSAREYVTAAYEG